jgi:trans-aconitate methyltransferase
MNPQQHWNTVYETKGERDVSWFEGLPAISLRMLEAAGLTATSCVIDVGGGDSHLVDHLTARGVTCLAILDISGAALARCRSRLGVSASIPTWIETDVTAPWTVEPMDIWHDRAVFHFLTAAADRARYLERLCATLKPGGSVVLATFAPDGPERCSGLPVQRYSAESLAAELGGQFALAETQAHVHTTPRGTSQSFVHSRFTRTASTA